MTLYGGVFVVCVGNVFTFVCVRLFSRLGVSMLGRFATSHLNLSDLAECLWLFH